jgi:molybdopterin-guanine dinucleotide biosynthesis protein A
LPEALAPGFEHLADSGEGPLGALALALAWAELRKTPQLLVIAADLPLLRGEHLAALIAAASRGRTDRAYCALGPQGDPEPLCAVYPSDWAHEVGLRFARGRRAARSVWLREPCSVNLDSCADPGPTTASESSSEVTVSVTVRSAGRDTIHPCFNLNDQEDWEQLQRWSKKGELP